MTAAVMTVADVQAVAAMTGMREVRVVDDLHGSWWLPGVDLRCSMQGPDLSIAVLATIRGAEPGVWRWRANVSAGIDPADLADLVRAAARVERVSGVAS